jgi:hypothetical protein
MRSNDNIAAGRRDFFRNVAGIIAGGMLVVRGLARLDDEDSSERPGIRTPAREAVRAYLGPVVPGAVFAGATVEHVYDVHLGAIAIVAMSATGARFQIDVLAADRGDGAVGRTEAVSLFVRGRPGAATPEDQGLAAMAIASVLRGREAAGAKPPPGLLALRERLRRHPGGHFDALA